MLALGSITTNKDSGGDGIPIQLFQILKDDALKVLLSICQQIWKTQHRPQDWKRAVFIPIPKKDSDKECSSCAQLHSFNKLAGQCSKSFKNIQMCKLGLEKAEAPKIKLPASVGSSKKQENTRKTSTSASLATLKPLTVWITTNSSRDGNTRAPYLPPEKPVCRSRSNS